MTRGRKQTDKSLSAERSKTDRSFAERRAWLEDAADRLRHRDRAHRDAERSASRRKSDDARDATRAGNLSRAEERRAQDDRLRKERKRFDRALAAERSGIDRSMARERDASHAEARSLFDGERRATDRDLSRERTYADAAARRLHGFLLAAEATLTDERDSLLLRDEFLGLLSHDLKKPMLEISLSADRLRRNVFRAGADREDRLQVERIARNSQVVLRLVGDLMERVALWNAADARLRGGRSRTGRGNGTPTARKAKAAKRKPAKKVAKKRSASRSTL